MPTVRNARICPNSLAGRGEEQLAEDEAHGGGVDEEVVPLDGGADDGREDDASAVGGRGDGAGGSEPGRRLCGHMRLQCHSTALSGRCSEEVLAGCSQIIYDFEYDARARELMTTSNGCRSRPLRGRSPCARARSSRSTSATRRAPTSAAAARTRPSYFFKPSSSVAASGGTIERPAGTELLAFEGEIALVIGTRRARASPLEDAWGHVAWVTAANDFGLYDLRANDKGSNVRSKGGDGFTPIGPTLHRRPRGRPGRAARAHLGQRRRSRRTTRPRGCCSRSPSWSPTSRSTSRSSRAT